jgi:hypothetical protein
MKILTYLLKHKAKDDINSEKKLINICLDDEADDLRTLFSDDNIALEIINKTEKKVFDYYNKIVKETDILFEKYDEIFKLYQNSSDIDTKKALRKQVVSETINNDYFSLVMQKMDNRDIDFKDFVRGRI